MTETIEQFLYSRPPTKSGFPDSSLSVSVAFEVGGAHEDWGWQVKKDGDVIAEEEYLDRCLAKARKVLMP